MGLHLYGEFGANVLPLRSTSSGSNRTDSLTLNQPPTTPESGSHSLSIRELSKYYGTLAAVDNVSLEVERGQFLTMLGPSGSGKTTILMSIAGFVSPSAGDIFLDDQCITAIAPDKRNFGMVFQGYALFPHLNVEDNVWFPLRVRGVSKSDARPQIARALELSQMTELANRLPAQLSGGQQQRVALARALSFEPHLLLLDEPLSALDKKLRADLQWELKSLHKRLGTTFIYVTHDQEEALSMSDEIAILREGRIEQRGRPGDLYERPSTRFVADFLGKSNFLSGTVTDSATAPISLNVNGSTIKQGGDLGAYRDGDAVTVALRPEKVGIYRREPDVENRLLGRITASSYVGASHHFQVTTKALGELMVTAAAWTCDVDPYTRDDIWIGWQPDASVVVRDD